MGPLRRPTLVRIPFSHYCRKAEWGLTQAGLPYDAWDLLPPGARRLPATTRGGTVPVLLLPDRGSDAGTAGAQGPAGTREPAGTWAPARTGEPPAAVEGSDHILPWAARHAAPGTLPLYPAGAAEEARAWEAWAGDEVGPVARREAYRVWYTDPGHLTQRRLVHLVARASRPVALGVLKHYKARRFDASDRAAAPALFARVRDGLAATGNGFLVADHPTAADISVAALCEPFLAAAPGRDYDALPGYAETEAFVQRIRPAGVLRRHRTWMRRRHWRELARRTGTSPAP